MDDLINDFYNIVDGYYRDSEAFRRIEAALKRIENIDYVVANSSLANDGMMMIESAMRDEDGE
jgi:hypothetical protein